jgi:hypothetical protein
VGRATGLSATQLAALARLKPLAHATGLHLVGGSAIAVHLGHRRSADLDLFSVAPGLDLERVRRGLIDAIPTTKIVDVGEATLHARCGRTPIDIVAYPYRPLIRPRPGPHGVAIASLTDLAAMKLAAVARRGIRRDFWDLHAIVTSGRLGWRAAIRAYVRKFATAEPDLYPVLRSLTYFADADAEPMMPAGLTESAWKRIKLDLQRLATSSLDALG